MGRSEGNVDVWNSFSSGCRKEFDSPKVITYDLNKRVYELEKPTGNEPIVANDNPALFYNYEICLQSCEWILMKQYFGILLASKEVTL